MANKIYVGTFQSTINRYHTFEVEAADDAEAIQKAKDLYTNSINMAGYIAGATPSEGWPVNAMIKDLILSGTTEPHYACQNVRISDDPDVNDVPDMELSAALESLVTSQELIMSALNSATAIIREGVQSGCYSANEQRKTFVLNELENIHNKVQQSMMMQSESKQRIKLNG
jgi:hypothetical protein